MKNGTSRVKLQNRVRRARFDCEEYFKIHCQHYVIARRPIYAAYTWYGNSADKRSIQSLFLLKVIFEIFSVGRAPGIRLSVEYSEETEVLKVRVWSLQSLVLKPELSNTPNVSIHVRSCVFPGAKIWSKTEDNMVEKFLPNQGR